MSQVNILQNGELDAPFHSFRNNDKLEVAQGWLPWWAPHETGEPGWKNQVPVLKAVERDGRQLQSLASPWGTHTAGVLQQAPTVASSRYELEVECQAWSSEEDGPDSLVEASDMNVQIGIDPTGGLDPASPLIVWSEVIQPLGEWRSLTLMVEAQAGVITVFLKSAPALPKRQQLVYWRQARLTPLGRYRRSVSLVGAGDTHITLEPEQPEPGEQITATVSSARNQVFSELTVQRPDNQQAAVVFKGLTQEQGRFIWRYEFSAVDAGLHDVRFVGDQGARLLAQRLVRVAERDPLEEEAQEYPSGQPRLDYHRVYVLLPPTADVKWATAAARGSFDGRYTVGFSADDAGLGEIEGRHVLAVNPHHWPETLTAAWYHKNYPGTRFTAVVANTPEDLESWLRSWTDEA